MRARLEGSFRDAWPGTRPGIAVDPERHTRLTVWFDGADHAATDARAAERLGAIPIGERTYETRRAFRARTDASDPVAREIERYASAHGLSCAERHWRSIGVHGRMADLVEAFGATVDVRTSPAGGASFQHRHDWLHLPSHLARDVRGIFGFAQWCPEPRVGSPVRDRTPLEPAAVARRYRFPVGRGHGQTIGILAYESTYRADDFALAMRRLGLRRAPPVLKHVDGARADRHPATAADLEAATDVQIVAALAPDARVVVYEAPHGERGCLDAIRTAIFDEEDAPSVISISYGIVERNWTRASLAILDELFVAAALLGISVFVASGDHGAELDDRGHPHVNAPASSPFVVACGATKLHRDEAGETHEIAWHRSGGGFGRADTPAWQSAARAWATAHGMRPGRGVPDVAAQCDPGYPVIFEGEELSMHGTSTTAPMWSALAARMNESTTRAFGPFATIGFFLPLLYDRARDVMRSVARGRNETFEACDGWNPLAGLGVPDGIALEAMLLGK